MAQPVETTLVKKNILFLLVSKNKQTSYSLQSDFRATWQTDKQTDKQKDNENPPRALRSNGLTGLWDDIISPRRLLVLQSLFRRDKHSTGLQHGKRREMSQFTSEVEIITEELPYFPDYKSRFFTKKRDREKRGATYIRDATYIRGFRENRRSWIVESEILLENVQPPCAPCTAACGACARMLHAKSRRTQVNSLPFCSHLMQWWPKLRTHASFQLLFRSWKSEAMRVFLSIFLWSSDGPSFNLENGSS